MEDVFLSVDGLRLVGELRFPDGAAPFPTLCICHGIPAGSTPDPADRGYPGLADEFAARGFLTFIFNFRGSGLSDGNFDMAGWGRDLSAAIDFLGGQPAADRRRLYVMGFSGGAAVSICVAAADARVAAVVACACPAELGTWLASPESTQSFLQHARAIGIIRDPDFPPSLDDWRRGFRDMAAIDHVAAIAPRPLLLVHGDADEVVAPSSAQRLYERAGEPKEMAMIGGGGHRLRQNAAAMAAATEWLRRVARL